MLYIWGSSGNRWNGRCGHLLFEFWQFIAPHTRCATLPGLASVLTEARACAVPTWVQNSRSYQSRYKLSMSNVRSKCDADCSPAVGKLGGMSFDCCSQPNGIWKENVIQYIWNMFYSTKFWAVRMRFSGSVLFFIHDNVLDRETSMTAFCYP